MAFKEPKKEKGAHIKAPPDAGMPPGKEYLTVSLRHIRGSHCITHCDPNELASFADKLRILTGKSWLELSQAHRHGLGYEKIARTSLTVQVPNHVTADVNIIAFRFSGNKPMVGYKDGETFHVLWFDRAFNVYDHE